MAHERVEDLLRRGLDSYALNNAAEAIRLWEEAARLDPADTRAAEYIAALRGEGPAPEDPIEPERIERRTANGLRQVVDALATPGALAPKAFDRAQFIDLLRAKRFEEALDTLYQMHQVAPENASVSRGIQVLKDKLLADYLARLGHLDRVVGQTNVKGFRVSADEAEVLRLVDGIASLGDVLSSSRLGRLATARALSRLLDRGAVGPTEPEAGPAASVDPPPDAPVPAPAAAATVRYDAMFRQATEAYLRRDVDTALALFTQCLEARPGDRRVQHNIERLQQRKRNS